MIGDDVEELRSFCRRASAMELTSLGCEKDPAKESRLACHMLDFEQCRVLLECPIDLSALALFLPAPFPAQANSARGFAERKRKGNRDSFLRSSPSTKRVRVRLNHEDRGEDGSGENGRDKGGEHMEMIKEVNGQVLAKAEPWYKVAGLELVDVGMLDAVVISNPSGMLGLPFLTKHPDFYARVYATKATAEIGRMMMEELVLTHAEFVPRQGRLETGQKPPWLDPSRLDSLSGQMKSSSLGRCFSNRANWQPLYSAQDIRDCFLHVQKLRLGEEVNICGSLRVSPSSSGMGIGASNWIISGASQSVGYVAASLVTKNHAMPLDMAPLVGCQTLIVSDVEECSREAERVISSREDRVIKAQEGPEIGLVGPVRQSSSGSGVSQRPTPKTNGSFSSASARGGLPSSSAVKSSAAALPPGAAKGGNAELVSSVMASLGLMPEVASACKGAIEALRRGGSVLFPISPCGSLLELLDELGVQLGAANLKHIPIHYISTAAEEMLAYCNTVPEWLCSTRQEKLYAGESLFGYVDLLQEGRLHHSKAFSTPELKKVLQAPCVVFAAHFSLRMGPAAHLLHCWRQNRLCLLVLTEGTADKDLLLAPYMPLSMQVLELPASLRLRTKEVISLVQRIHPQVALVPEFLQSSAGIMKTKLTLGYRNTQSVRVPNSETELEVDMTAELAFQVRPQLVKPKQGAAVPFQADFCFRDGKLSLQPSLQSAPDVLHDCHYRWGQVNVGALSRALQERGMGGVSVHESVVESSSQKCFVVEIRSPSRAWIELGPNSSHIKANEAEVRRLIADAVNSVLQVM